MRTGTGDRVAEGFRSIATGQADSRRLCGASLCLLFALLACDSMAAEPAKKAPGGAFVGFITSIDGNARTLHLQGHASTGGTNDKECAIVCAKECLYVVPSTAPGARSGDTVKSATLALFKVGDMVTASFTRQPDALLCHRLTKWGVSRYYGTIISMDYETKVFTAGQSKDGKKIAREKTLQCAADCQYDWGTVVRPDGTYVTGPPNHRKAMMQVTKFTRPLATFKDFRVGDSVTIDYTEEMSGTVCHVLKRAAAPGDETRP